MAWTGKAVGTAVGSVFGIFGAGVGMWLGHLYDQEQTATAEMEQPDFWELRLNFMRALAGVATVDGPLTSRERKCLDCISADLFPDLNETQLWSVRQTTTNGAFSPQQAAALAMTMDAEGQVGLISQLISIVYTDGEFGPEETNWMQQFTDAAGIPLEKWNWLLVLFDRFANTEDTRLTALQTLGLPPEATEAEIKARYRQQAGEYHPDRLGHLSPAIRELAEHKMKEINHAYQVLTKVNLEPTGPAEPMAAMDAHEHRAIAEHRLSKGSVVGCPLCQRINRLPERAKFGAARCGSCFALLILPLPVVQECLRQQNPNQDYENTDD